MRTDTRSSVNAPRHSQERRDADTSAPENAWEHTFDWCAQEQVINAFSHFRASVDGFGIHFIHERGKGPNPMPLTLPPREWAERSYKLETSQERIIEMGEESTDNKVLAIFEGKQFRRAWLSFDRIVGSYAFLLIRDFQRR